ncbi:HXXEE domain-containing protein [Silvibacterium sp.]|uniref:HXXEE domain-containing protein n=1 Tax=Silvibacterium sp. TaxID=1964179 RepID=UPI0039E3E45B
MAKKLREIRSFGESRSILLVSGDFVFLRLWSKSIWLYVMLLLGGGVLFALATHRENWSTAQKIVAFTYVLVPLHAWEEWRIPGGFGYEYNWVMGKSDLPDRYPMNQLTDMITVFGAMWFGIILLYVGVTPGVLLSQTFFAFAETAMHLYFGYEMYRKFKPQGKRTIYNPGFATVLIGFFPLFLAGVFSLLHSHLSGRDWWTALGILLVLSGIIFLPPKFLGTRENPYSFAPGYYARFLR